MRRPRTEARPRRADYAKGLTNRGPLQKGGQSAACPPSIEARRPGGHATLCPPYELNTTSRSRDADRVRALLNFLSLERREGAGNAGCLLHPRSRVHKCAEEAHTSIQVQTEQSGIPCAMALRLMPCSPRRRIRLVTVVSGFAADQARSS